MSPIVVIRRSPDVVIFERNGALGAVDLLKRVPGALLIDVGIDPGPTVTYRRAEIQGVPEGILQAIRGTRRLDTPALVGSMVPESSGAAGGG